MSQSKNLIVLQEELTKEGRFSRTVENRNIRASYLANMWPGRRVM
jgi:hypothetical protein